MSKRGCSLPDDKNGRKRQKARPRPTPECVTIGLGWARNGMRFIILHFAASINRLSKDPCVSFEPPNGDTPGDGVYALHMQNKDDAAILAALLK